ncbi:MAG: phosphotransferase, partial [Ilumatobacteraceae bacterium]
MPLPSKRNPEDLARTLETWFETRLGAPVDITDVAIPDGTGMSSETLLMTLHDGRSPRDIVVRLAPDMSDWPVFPIYDLAAQAQAMALVAECSTVPVPDVLFVERNASILGSPFLVMKRVGGRALPDMPPYVFGGSYMDQFSVEQQRELTRVVARLQARIHAIDLDFAAEDGIDLSF